MGEPPFLKLERKIQFFFFTAQISSKVRSRFVYGTINLKFGGDVRDSLIFILNGGDRIWRSRRSSFSPRIESPIWCVFYLDSFDHELRSRLIRGSIKLIFGKHVQNSLVFIRNGGDWIRSSEKLYFSLRTVVCLVRSLYCFYAKLLKLLRSICLEIWLMYASSFI